MEVWLIHHWEVAAKVGIGLFGPVVGAWFMVPSWRRLLLNVLSFVTWMAAAIFVSKFWSEFATEHGIRSYALLGESVPIGLKFAISFLVLDLVNYGLHRLEHAVPFLWAMHKFHHQDEALDLSTHLRKHPVGALYSITLFSVIIIGLGLPPLSVFAYNLMGDLFGFIEHSTLDRFPKLSRLFANVGFMTPIEHHLHHSRKQFQTDTNYGLTVNLWDQIFGTHLTTETSAGIEYGLDPVETAADLPARARALVAQAAD